MKITTTRAGGKAVLKIAGELRIATVAEAKPDIVAALASCGEVEIDLCEVAEVDTAGVQLLLMACASARANAKRFATVGLTAGIRALLDRIGVPVECLEFPSGTPDRAEHDHAAG